MADRTDQASTKNFLWVERLRVVQHVKGGTGQLVRDRFDRHDRVGLPGLSIEVALCLGIETHREVSRFDKGPGQILVAVLRVVVRLLLAVRQTARLYTPAVRSEVA